MENNSTEVVDSELHNGLGAILPIAVMSVEGVVGNSLLIISILTDRKLRTYIDAFVCNVAAMDLIVTGILLPAKIPFLLYDRNIYSPPACNFFAILAIASCTGSVVSLAAVAVNKFLYVCHNSWYSRVFNKKSTGVIIAFSWVYSFLLACPPALGWAAITYDSATASCTLAGSVDVSYDVFLAIFGLGLPTLITVGCYGGIFLKMYRSRKKVQATGNQRSKKKNYAQIYTMFVVSSLFSLSWLPYCFMFFLDIVSPEFQRTATWLGLSNSCMNCVVLIAVNKNYQEAYRRLLCRVCMRRDKTAHKLGSDQSQVTKQSNEMTIAHM